MNFTTKDSGQRMAFDGGMVRDTQAGKVLYHLLFDGPLLARWAELLTRGAEKYSEHNWMKANGAAELERFKASAARHFFQWMRGDTDEDHAAAVVFNLNGAEYVKLKLAELANTPLEVLREAAKVDVPVETVDLDKCGTTDGVTPLPALRVNLKSHAENPNSNFKRNHYLVEAGVVSLVEVGTGKMVPASIPLDVLIKAFENGEYVVCDEQGKAV